MIVYSLYLGRSVMLNTPPSSAEVKYECSYACTAPLRIRGALPAVGLYVRRRPWHAEPKVYVDGFFIQYLFNLLFRFSVALNAIAADGDLIACYLTSVSVSL
jgi:hypothetical protein